MLKKRFFTRKIFVEIFLSAKILSLLKNFFIFFQKILYYRLTLRLSLFLRQTLRKSCGTPAKFRQKNHGTYRRINDEGPVKKKRKREIFLPRFLKRVHAFRKARNCCAKRAVTLRERKVYPFRPYTFCGNDYGKAPAFSLKAEYGFSATEFFGSSPEKTSERIVAVHR